MKRDQNQFVGNEKHFQLLSFFNKHPACPLQISISRSDFKCIAEFPFLEIRNQLLIF